jgi:hypothetical protein
VSRCDGTGSWSSRRGVGSGKIACKKSHVDVVSTRALREMSGSFVLLECG